MIICRTCGRRNPNGTEFCTNCGEYLEFDGDQVKTTTFQAADPDGGPPTAAAPPPTPVPLRPAPSPAPEPVRAPPPSAATSPAPPSPTTPAARPPAKGGGDEAEEAAGEAMDPAVAERARRLLAKAPAPGQPKARPPEVAQTRPPPAVKQREPTRLRPGELACPNCGMGNGPERNFCRRCGTVLHAPQPPPVPVPIPQAPAPARTEQRPAVPPPARDNRPWYRRPVPLIGTALLTVLALVLLVVLGRTLVGALGGGDGGKGGQEPAAGVPLKPSKVFASSNKGHVADRAIDGDDATAWPGDVPSERRPERIWVSFGTPVEVTRVEITPGAPGADFGRQPRPRHGFLKFSDETTVKFELQDRAGPQGISFPARRVDEVVVNVTDAYDARPGTKAPITELRLYGPGKG